MAAWALPERAWKCRRLRSRVVRIPNGARSAPKCRRRRASRRAAHSRPSRSGRAPSRATIRRAARACHGSAVRATHASGAVSASPRRWRHRARAHGGVERHRRSRKSAQSRLCDAQAGSVSSHRAHASATPRSAFVEVPPRPARAAPSNAANARGVLKMPLNKMFSRACGATVIPSRRRIGRRKRTARLGRCRHARRRARKNFLQVVDTQKNRD